MEKVLEKLKDSIHDNEIPNQEYSKISKIHKYWARKPWYIVEEYIQRYSKPKDLVLDPFCGSGCVGLEAVINGRNFRGQDLNPIAIQISKGTLKNSVSISSLKDTINDLQKTCAPLIMKMYETDRICQKCGEKLYFRQVNYGRQESDGSVSAVIYCPDCKSKGTKISLSANDVKKLISSKQIKITRWTPDTNFPKKFYKDRFSYKGVSSVNDMYTPRNLCALSILFDAIQKIKDSEIKELFLLAFSNTLLHVSKLKGENVRPLSVNNYWIPNDFIEENVWFRFKDRCNNLLQAKTQQGIREQEKQQEGKTYGSWEVRKASALDSMGSNEFDYIFTDPPYGDAIQYSELSYIWNAWLGTSYDNKEEVIINPTQNKGVSEFTDLLGTSLKRIYTALKPNKYFTLCFQNKNSDIWNTIIQQCKDIGFSLVDVSIYNTYGSPFNKHWAEFSPKSDIYVTFQKKKAVAKKSAAKIETFGEIVSKIAKYMDENHISKEQNRFYDLTIVYLIWALYEGHHIIDLKNFDIKKFALLSEAILTCPDRQRQLLFSM